MTEPLWRASGIPFKCTDECQKLSMSYQIRRSHFENVDRMISAVDDSDRCRERSGILLRGPDLKKPDRLAANQSARFVRIPDRKINKYIYFPGDVEYYLSSKQKKIVSQRSFADLPPLPSPFLFFFIPRKSKIIHHLSPSSTVWIESGKHLPAVYVE